MPAVRSPRAAPATDPPRPCTAVFRFHGDLDDLRPRRSRGGSTVYAFDGTPSVKDAIEALGVPHTEVDAIVINGRAVDFAHRLRDGDQVEVYPPAGSPGYVPQERLEHGPPPGSTSPGRPPQGSGGGTLPQPGAPGHAPRTGPGPLTPPVPRPARFILDTHLGRLAAYLRMLGFDCAYGNHADDEELAERAAVEGRVLLTRDRGLLRRSAVRLGCLLRSDDPQHQLEEVVARFDLRSQAAPFTRCIRCNGRIEPVDRGVVADRLQPKTLRYFDTFGRCESCAAVYWQGSHYERMRRIVERVLAGAKSPP